MQVLTPADDVHHINKHNFKVPFVCGCRDLGEALRRIAEGAAMIRTKVGPVPAYIMLPAYIITWVVLGVAVLCALAAVGCALLCARAALWKHGLHCGSLCMVVSTGIAGKADIHGTY